MSFDPHRNPSAQYQSDGVRSILVDSQGGGSFTTITQAVAAIAALPIAAPRYIKVAQGAYAESFTLPAQCTLEGVGDVLITGTITCAAAATTPTYLRNLRVAGSIVLNDSATEYILENVTITQAAAGIALDADMGGLAATGLVTLRNVRLITNNALATALAGQSCLIDCDILNVECILGGVGIDLVAGDAATEVTRFIADRVEIVGTGLTAGIRTAGGAGAAAVDQVRAEITHLLLDIQAASVGVIANANATQLEGLPSGFYIDDLECVATAAGAANAFFRSSAAGEEHRIGRVFGNVVSDILFDHDAGNCVVDVVDFPNDGIAKDSFQVVVITAGNFTINGGVVAPGTSAPFQSVAGAGNLTVRNLRIPGSTAAGGVGRLYLSADITGTITFEHCFVRMVMNAAMIVLDGGATPGTLRLIDSVIEATGAGAFDLITDTDCTIQLIDSVLIQPTAAQNCVNIAAPAFAVSFEWQGSCQIQENTGGAGFGLLVAASANITLIENGLLQFSDNDSAANVSDWFSIGAGVVLQNNTGPHAVVTAAIPSLAAAGGDILGDAAANTGVPSSYPGLHFCTTLDWGMTGSGGVDTYAAGVTVENETTTVNTTSAASMAAVDPLAGVYAYAQSALAATLPVGPGQEIRMTLGASGGGAPGHTCTLR